MKTEPPSLGEIFYNKGEQARDIGHLGHAEAMWREALREEPHNAHFQASLADLYAEQGAMEQAVACWKEAVKNSPSDVGYANGLASAMRHANQHPGAGIQVPRACNVSSRRVPSSQDLQACDDARAAFCAPTRQTADAINAHAAPAGSSAPGASTAAAQHNANDEPYVTRVTTRNMQRFRVFPKVMATQGVPEAMYRADVARLTKSVGEINDRMENAARVVIFTCGLGMLFMPSRLKPHVRTFSREIVEVLTEMNQRYARFGIHWNFSTDGEWAFTYGRSAC